VQRVEGTYEFEVQPLREYYAARYLYNTAPYSPTGNERKGTKPDRFDAMSRDFYWLNVTRFYAGCYSKGELPSLVDRLQDLTGEAGYRNTSHPTMLAATFLADWVFTQHPKSVRDALALVMHGLGLRLLLASGNRRAISGGPLVLPDKCGREELVQRCFSILDTSPPHDYAIELTDLIRTNSNPSEIENYWVSCAARRDKESRSNWLEYGLLLGVLPRIKIEVLRNVLSDAPMDQTRLGWLFTARRFDLIETDEQLCESVVALALKRSVALPRHRADSVLDLFCQSLDPYRWARAFDSRNPTPMAELWQRHPAYQYVPLDAGGFAAATHSSTLSKCRELVAIAGGESAKTAMKWASEVAPWSAIVEKTRSLWGESWAALCLANVAAGVRSGKETCNQFSELLDHSAPLCYRARYARLRAGSTAWWRKQLEHVRTEFDTMLASLVLLSWASVGTLRELCPTVATAVESLSDDAWQGLMSSLRVAVALFHDGNQRNRPILHADLLPSALSSRAVVALSARTAGAERTRIYRTFLRNYAGDDASVLGFCQERAIESLKSEPVPDGWRADLELIRKGYTKGIASPARGLYAGIRWRPAAPLLALEVAEEITSNAANLPTQLVAVAEARCRHAVAERIVPVGKVAALDGWFNI
jgi:hypothetical protein